MTTLPDFVVKTCVWYFSSILADGSSRLRRISTGVILASSWARSGPTCVPTPFILWHETQLATSKICLPLANDRPLRQAFDRRRRGRRTSTPCAGGCS